MLEKLRRFFSASVFENPDAAIRAPEEREIRRRAVLEKVVTLGKSITEVSDLKTTLIRIWHGVHDDLGYDRLAIFLHNPANNSIEGTFGTNLKGEIVEEWEYTRPLDQTEPTSFTRVLEQPDGLYFTHNFAMENHIPEGQEMYGVKDYVSVAAWAGSKPVAIICGDNAITQRNISEEQLDALRLFAGYAGLAIENARLYQAEQERRQEAETLHESLASIVGALDFSEIIQRILDQIKLVIPYDTASVWRLDGEWLTLIVGRDLPSEFLSNFKMYLTGENSSRPLIHGEKPFLLNNNIQESRTDFQGPSSYVNSWLAVPLKKRGKIIGQIALDGKNKGQFTAHHAELALTFADQVAIALENASLYEELQSELTARQVLIRELERKNAEAKTLRESTAIVAATLEISETVNRILEQIKHVVQYDSASVWLYQDEYAFLKGSNGLPPGAELPGKYRLSEKEPDHSFWGDKVPYILLDDIQEQYPEFRKPAKDYIHGWLTIPLRVRGNLTGFISLDSSTPGKFTEHDAELALTFADQVAIALENASLYEEVQQELSERKRTEQALSDAETMYRALVEQTTVVPYRDAVDLKGSSLYISPQIERLIGYSAAEWLSDAEFWQEVVHPDDLPGVLDNIKKYITTGERTIGEFRLQTKDDRWIWVRDETIVVKDEENKPQFVHGVFIDITERKRAEEALQKSSSRLALLHDIDRALLSAQSPAEIASEALHRIRQLIPSPRVSITLFDFEKNEAIFLVASFDDDFDPAGQSVITLQEYGQYIIDELLQNKACWVDDVLTDPRCNQLDKTLAQKGLRSWLYLPLISQGQLFGGLNFARPAGSPFTAEEESIAYDVSNQLAIVLKQNQLYESLQSELTERTLAETNLLRRESLLNAVAFSAEQFLKSSDWHMVIDAVLERLGRELDASHAYLFERHKGPNGETLSSMSNEWTAPGFVSDLENEAFQNIVPVDLGWEQYYETLDEGLPLVGSSSSFTVKERKYWNSMGVKALLEMRVIVNHRQWGVLGFDYEEKEREWSPSEVDVIKVAANVLGAAIKRQLDNDALKIELTERKQAEDTLRQRDSILEAVTHASQVFLHSPDWRESINDVLGELGKATDASHVYIFENHILDDGRKATSQKYEWYSPTSESDIDDPKYQNVILFGQDQQYWSDVLSKGQTYIGDMDKLPMDEADYFQSRGIKSILDVPIFVGGEWWGVIGFDDYIKERRWSPVEIEALEVAGKMISAAIEREKMDDAIRLREEEYRSELEDQVTERTSQLIAANHLLITEKARIEQVVNEVATLRRLSDFLQSSMTVDEASSIIASHMSSLFTDTSGGLYLINDGFTDLALMSSWGEFKTETVIQPNDCWGMRRGRSFVRHASDASPVCAHFGGEIPDESLCLPLMGQNEIIGMLCLQVSKNENTYFTSDIQNLAIACADSVALALANLRLRERLRNQTIRDPLTGIFNRRYLEETLEREVHRAGRNYEPLCVIMFEIDNFKQYNNTFGHDAGDYVLKKIADTMRSNLRRSDFPCRYGGDEFTLLLPNTTLEDGAHRAEELRKAIEALALSFNNQALGQVTVRLGVAVYPKHGETGEAVLKVADDASYRARAIGKNCVVVAD